MSSRRIRLTTELFSSVSSLTVAFAQKTGSRSGEFISDAFFLPFVFCRDIGALHWAYYSDFYQRLVRYVGDMRDATPEVKEAVKVD